MKPFITTIYRSKAGDLILGSLGDKLCLCDWVYKMLPSRHPLAQNSQQAHSEGSSTAIRQTIAQLDSYFEGRLTEFSVPLLFAGTPFQCKVWNELLNIPYGTVTFYSDISRRIGNCNATRAVATAIASNPISILVPCHRVIGRNGTLTGYRGGLIAKQFLLEHESTIRFLLT